MLGLNLGFKLGLKLKRSRGVPITAWVHRMLQRGNKARDRRDWAAAADAYGQALRAEDNLAHIWVQYGHALKEQGETGKAEAAYRRAGELQPDDADPFLHLGHMAKLQGDRAAAGRHYLAAFQANPGDADAAGELHRVVASASARSRAHLVDVIRATLGDAADGFSDGTAAVVAGGADSLVFDASDLVGYYNHARLPTGIQRVQIQAITNALQGGGDVRVCCFIDGRDDWLEIPAPVFQALVALSLEGGERAEPAWVLALNRLHLGLSLARPFVFPRGSTLVNLGSSWQLHNYFLFVREAKVTRGIRYVPFVHDLIPIVAPEHFTDGAKREVVPWVLGIFDHADCFLANSEATKRDLVATGTLLGHRIDPEDVAVIPLDADFRRPGTERQASGPLGRWGLEGVPFVLFVSTVESRKGHAAAFDAWRALIGRHGADRVPMLVCVGKRGWLAEGIYTRLEQDAVLAGRVAMLSGVSDADLALLYRSCLFTVYPSRYEGWGLPITEALCYGKTVVASDTSSLPEAGGVFAVYVPPGDVAAFAAAVERLAFDGTSRVALERLIAAEFRPRTWAAIAGQIRDELVRLGARGNGRARPAPRPTVRMGDYHTVARGTAVRLWPGARSSDAFRVGTGWRAPTPDGSWTRPQGGELAITLPAHDGPLRLGLLLLGAQECDIVWSVSVRGGPLLTGVLRPHRQKWVTQALPAALTAGGPLRIRLRGEPAEPDPARPDEDGATVGLAGFFVYPLADVAAGTRLLEAVAFDTLEEVDADRPPAPPSGTMEDWPG